MKLTKFLALVGLFCLSVSNVAMAETVSWGPKVPKLDRSGVDYIREQSKNEGWLAQTFANGTAEFVPNGSSEGYPIFLDEYDALKFFGHMLHFVIPGADFNVWANTLWNGKNFKSDGKTGTLENNMLPESELAKIFGGGSIQAFKANVSIRDLAKALKTSESDFDSLNPLDDTSYPLDHKPSVILDYTKAGNIPVIKNIIDEVRHVSLSKDGKEFKDLYLGRATLYGKFLCWFILQFPEQGK